MTGFLIMLGLFKQSQGVFIAIMMAAMTLAVNASPRNFQSADSLWYSTKQDALNYLYGIKQLETSSYWPNVKPGLFLENLKTFVVSPLEFYEGRSTNFCAYSALTFIPFYYNPLMFCQFMITLYKTGKAKMGKVNFHPGARVRNEAGLLKYKGILDINPMGQMWFLSLADHFKGYLNFFNHNFDEGDENTLWAVTNLAKFKRMLRRLFPLEVHAKGSDLFRPLVRNMYDFLHEKLNAGPVFLLVNYRLLYNIDHIKMRLGIPNHFIHLLDIQKTNTGTIDLYYSDNGVKTLQQVTPPLLRKIIFGITWCSINRK